MGNKIKPFLVLSLFFGFFSFAKGTIFFSDGFEGDLNWNEVGPGWKIVTYTPSAHSGKSRLHIDGKEDVLNSPLSKTISLSGNQNLKIGFWIKVGDLEKDDSVVFEYSFDGQGFEALETFTEGNDQIKDWKEKVFTLPIKGDSLKVRFRATLNGGEDTFDLDDFSIEIEGEEIQKEREKIEEPSSEIQPSDVVINEILSDPADGEEEWVELFNNTEREIDLENWVLEEGSGSRTKISGKIPAKGFLVIEKINGYLNNKGDLLILKNKEGRVIDQLTYGDFDDGNLNDNAPVAKEPYSLGRKIDGKDSNQDNLDFILMFPSKGEGKKSLAPSNVSNILINEVLPNPEGSDLEDEFIELKNLNSFDLFLDGWRLEDEKGKSFDLSGKKILANGFLTLKRKETKIALNNFGKETINLRSPDGNLVDSVSFSAEGKENVSFARTDKDWFWTKKLTPGSENQIERLNEKPKIVIDFPKIGRIGEELLFDASDSFDPDGDEISFFWDFGDGEKGEGAIVKHTFKKEGNYSVNLKVKDSFQEDSSKTVKVKIPNGEEKFEEESKEILKNSFVILSEILPSPLLGGDEWIELFNPSDEEIDLSDFYLDDVEGQSKKFKIPEGTKILPKGYLLFFKKETKISLNNGGDSVRILDKDGNVIDEVSFEKAKRGYSFARDEEGDWHWTQILTPRKENQFSEEKKEEEKEGKDKILNVDLSEIKDLEKEVMVKTKGIVSVEPGVFGKRIFYLAGSGIEVYISKGEIPELKLGQEVELGGKISEVLGEKRINVDGNKIKILGQREIPKPKEAKIEELDDDLLANLVTFSGEVLEKKRNYLSVSDGFGEILVWNKDKLPKEGDKIRVTGILKRGKDGYKVLTRYPSDIEILERKESKTEPEIQKEDLKSFLAKNIKGKEKEIFILSIFTLLIFLSIKFYFMKKWQI